MKILLLQLPVPQLNYQKQTGNIPLAPAYLKQALGMINDLEVEIVPESISSYYSDSALINYILNIKPDMIGFTVYCWNVYRTMYIHEELKKQIDFISVAGGPEITRDNYTILNHSFDHIIYGEGEISFCELVSNLTKQNICQFALSKDQVSPYLLDYMENYIEKTMFLETQRGCPYKCGFCYYNKSRSEIIQFPLESVLKGIQYAYDNENIDQVYLMDPSLNSRSDLKHLLENIIRINKDKKLSFYSEIRAEFINNEWAQLFYEAGFKEFEVGLQSCNPKALEIMNRKTDIDRFVKGCNALKLYDIVPKIDLIIGLPGDTPAEFKHSVDFVYDQALDESMQVFALSVLAGTDYRMKSSEYKLNYQKNPPYYVQKTASFNWEDIYNSFKYAESAYGINIFPQPQLDFSYKNIQSDSDSKYSKLLFSHPISGQEIEYLSERLTNPYQLIFKSEAQSELFIKQVIGEFTQKNPFTAFEVVLYEPKLTNIEEVIRSSAKLSEYSFLENDLEYASQDKCTKSFYITIISTNPEMKQTKYNIRNIYHWKHDYLPQFEELIKFNELNGIFIDNNMAIEQILIWQSNLARKLGKEDIEDYPEALDIIPEYFFSFADNIAQTNWFKLFAESEFCFEIRQNIYLDKR